MTCAHDVWLFTELAKNPALSWRPFRPGVDIYPLVERPEGGSPAVALLRYQPGAAVPAHQHPGHEHIFVLAGAQEDENGRYVAGSVLVSQPGSGHTVRSPEGCVVLAIWEQPARFE
jgi:anti-sigma factor ChrR (cupin superfamily)